MRGLIVDVTGSACPQCAMATTPTAPGLLLADELKSLRNRVGWNSFQAAEEVGVSVATYRKYETGKVTISRSGLKNLIAEWNDLHRAEHETPLVTTAERDVLLELREQAEQPQWTSTYRLTETMSTLVGFESLAIEIWAHEFGAIYGPLQLKEYATLLVRGVDRQASEEEVEQSVQLRVERQARTFMVDNPPYLKLILDESTLRRALGHPQVVANQLEYLLTLTQHCEIRVLPFSAEASPALMGTFYVIHFPSKLRGPAVYTEGGARRNIYLSDPKAVASASLDFEHSWGLALNPAQSRELIRSAMEELRNE